MNAVEIEDAISALAQQQFHAAEFPFAFLEAFGNKPATILSKVVLPQPDGPNNEVSCPRGNSSDMSRKASTSP